MRNITLQMYTPNCIHCDIGATMIFTLKQCGTGFILLRHPVGLVGLFAPADPLFRQLITVFLVA